MSRFITLLVLGLGAGSVLTGCATSHLLEKDSGRMSTRETRVNLVEDRVVAFTKPTQQIAGLSAESIVIAGYKNSYVLTEGGEKFARLMNNLDPNYIQVNSALDFYSAKNDGRFTGKLAFSYARLKEQIGVKDREFFLRNQARECSSSSDERMNVQRFCFDIQLSGVVYPAVANISSLKPLSKPYAVTIYTQKKEQYYQAGKGDPVEKLVLFPFAVAFDVVTLPFQILNRIFD